MMKYVTNKREVHASVKDEKLIKVRRDQMIKGAVSLFKLKGFHRTTTREIARASGFSIGTLYEYIPGVAVPEASTVFSISLLILAAGGDFYRRRKLVSKS